MLIQNNENETREVVSDTVTERMTAALNEQEGRIVDLMEHRLAENNEQILNRINETNEETQIRLDHLLSLLQQHRRD